MDVLTIKFCRHVIDNTLFGVRVFDCWVVIGYKIALKNVDKISVK